MKPFIANFSLLFTVSALHGAEPTEKFPKFMSPGKKVAAATARKQAEADFAAGHYRILGNGLRPATEGDEVSMQH